MWVEILVLVLTVYHILCILFVSAFCRLMREKANQRANSEICQSSRKAYSKTNANRVKAGVFSCLYGMTRYYSILCGKIPSHFIRKSLYKHVFCMDIHNSAIIYGGSEIRSPWNIKIGKSTIGTNCILDGRYGIRIGDEVCLGGAVYIWTTQHNVNDKHFSTIGKSGCVQIDRYAWIASRSTVLPNIHIEEAAVVASGAVITKNCEKFGIYGGVPAKQIGTRKSDLDYSVTDSGFWWFY